MDLKNLVEVRGDVERGIASADPDGGARNAPFKHGLERTEVMIMKLDCANPARALLSLSVGLSAHADESLLQGSSRLESFVREAAVSGEPATDVPTDAERIPLHKSMLAYGGSYNVDATKLNCAGV
jgi:hypothetical protein